MTEPQLDPELTSAVRAWIADDPDANSAAELAAVLAAAESGDIAARTDLADRFSAALTFGTAGLRGPLRAGPNGMNTAVVRRAAAGLAAFLSDNGHAGGTVVIGYDGRHGSKSFAIDSAAILAAAGFTAQLLPDLLPTPVLAYAVRRQSAVAGVMVTASHNPPTDNGYKVYAADGAQIVPPTDRQIEAAIRAVPSVRRIERADTYQVLDNTLVDAYVSAVVDIVDRVAPNSPRAISTVHTAMHGVGAAVLRRAYAAAGFPSPLEVAAQAEPDPDFSSVAFPNPEEPGAMDLALELARATEPDLIIANDPDADRCAVGIPDPATGWRMLRGDEVGVLLADWLLQHGVRGTYATTIVSSTMLAAMAQRHGVGFAETLTGFKWIVRAADDLAFGYEEALGYAVAPDVVRDKDGISAALLMTQLAAALKADGRTVADRLTELAAEYGRYLTGQVSWRVSDPTVITAALNRVRAEPPTTLLGQPVTMTDLAPDADVLILRFDGGRVVLRPSGTEPKCKAYLEVVEPAPPGRNPSGPPGPDGPGPGSVAARLEELTQAVRRLLPL